MRNITEDNITQAVIARHAGMGDARLRDLMTSLVQHLHAFAREVKLSDTEWAQGIVFLTECARLSGPQRQELALLSDTLGLSTLVRAQNQRLPRGCTEPSLPIESLAPAAGPEPHGDGPAPGATLACHVRGRVQALDGEPIAGATVQAWQAAAPGGTSPAGESVRSAAGCSVFTDADGRFHFECAFTPPRPIPQDGPVGRMLRALGRHPWRPAHLQVAVNAPAYQRLDTRLFPADDPYLDSDAVFGVRSTLVANWVHHASGRTPDGQHSSAPFYTLDFVFVLNPTTGD